VAESVCTGHLVLAGAQQALEAGGAAAEADDEHAPLPVVPSISDHPCTISLEQAPHDASETGRSVHYVSPMRPYIIGGTPFIGAEGGASDVAGSAAAAADGAPTGETGAAAADADGDVSHGGSTGGAAGAATGETAAAARDGSGEVVLAHGGAATDTTGVAGHTRHGSKMEGGRKKAPAPKRGRATAAGAADAADAGDSDSADEGDVSDTDGADSDVDMAGTDGTGGIAPGPSATGATLGSTRPSRVRMLSPKAVASAEQELAENFHLYARTLHEQAAKLSSYFHNVAVTLLRWPAPTEAAAARGSAAGAEVAAARGYIGLRGADAGAARAGAGAGAARAGAGARMQQTLPKPEGAHIAETPSDDAK